MNVLGRLNLAYLSRSLLPLLLLATAPSGSGCGGDAEPLISPLAELVPAPEPEWEPDLKLFDAPDCIANEMLSAQGVRPAASVDYVELRAFFRESFYGPNPGATHTDVLDASGTKCATSSDRAKCEMAVDALRQEAELRYRHSRSAVWYNYLVTTTGDSLQTVDSFDQLAAFLAPIDTPQEAALMVWAQSSFYGLDCRDKRYGAVRSVSDGYEVLGYRDDYDRRESYQILFHVDKAGTVTSLKSKERHAVWQ